MPIRSLELPHFRFDPRKSKHVGQGQGDSKVGDVHRPGRAGAGPRARASRPATSPGIDYYEAEVTIDELAALIFEDLGLPNLEQKRQQELEAETVRFNEIRKHGHHVQPGQAPHHPGEHQAQRPARAGARFGGHPQRRPALQDLGARRSARESNAVVIAMRDVSGSMGEFEKYITRSFYFWMVRFLRTKYNNVQIVFITHHTEAKEVDEEAFFNLGESGGTQGLLGLPAGARHRSSERYDPERLEHLPVPLLRRRQLGRRRQPALPASWSTQLLERSNVFGYGEIQEGGRRLADHADVAFAARSSDQRFIRVTIRDKDRRLPGPAHVLLAPRADAEARG